MGYSAEDDCLEQIVGNCSYPDLDLYPEVDLYPEDQRSDIDEINELVHEAINNGFDRYGLAKSQTVYDGTLDRLTNGCTG